MKRSAEKLGNADYEVDPLTCPICHEPMHVIAVIEDQALIRKTLIHLGLWGLKSRPPPTTPKAQPLYTEPCIDYSVCVFLDNLVHGIVEM
jgi:hypothetical protein